MCRQRQSQWEWLNFQHLEVLIVFLQLLYVLDTVDIEIHITVPKNRLFWKQCRIGYGRPSWERGQLKILSGTEVSGFYVTRDFRTETEEVSSEMKNEVKPFACKRRYSILNLEMIATTSIPNFRWKFRCTVEIQLQLCTVQRSTARLCLKCSANFPDVSFQLIPQLSKCFLEYR